MNSGSLEHLLLMEKSFKTLLLDRFKSIASSDYFVDVGANYGQTLIEVYAHNRDVKYFGFEPNPEAIRFLRKLLMLTRSMPNSSPGHAHQKQFQSKYMRPLIWTAGQRLFLK